MTLKGVGLRVGALRVFRHSEPTSGATDAGIRAER
jgi:hypothetical protein